MTLANRLTISRLGFAAAAFICIVMDGAGSKIAALLLFAVASLTDWLDGKIARETGTVTQFGAIADPFVDKILVLAAFLAFASLRTLDVPLWAVFLIMVRELMISSLRVLAALQGSVMSAERAGKLKTLVQYCACYVIMAILIARELAVKPGCALAAQMQQVSDYTQNWPFGLTIIAMLVTVASGIVYLHMHWSLLTNSWSVKK
ncbi:MAG TPA: CDP-alcohol phosphatidyltransferase family protein [Elusimicrobiales bacterium]|nr:CDP-alcohol phosphatidyltransferase family protein [Elusimicrobiales bacterium]